MTQIINPLTLVLKAREVGVTSSGIKITDYDTSTGIITGTGFGSSDGYVYLLDRDTHAYYLLPTDSWSDTSITLATPIDLSTIQGNTCFFVKTNSGEISHKYVVYGEVSVPNWGIIYVQDDFDDTIIKVPCSSSTDLNALQGANNAYATQRTIAGITFYISQIVGFQFGDAITSYSVPSYFLSGCLNLNQPLVFTNKVITSTSSTYMLRYDYAFDCPIVFTNQTRVGNYFMSYCQNFNQPLDISMFSYMNATYFLQNGYAFNQELKLPETLSTTTVGAYFLSNCRSFNQDLVFPSNMTSLGNYFLQYGYGFNSNIIFGDGLSTLGTNFMYQCYSFNKPLTFPAALTSIPASFMNNTTAFNQKFNFQGNIGSIGANFLNSSAYNQDIDFLDNVTTIGNFFLTGCFSFNSDISLGTRLVSIGTNFLQNCYSFAKKLTIPSSVLSIGTIFLSNCYQFYNLETNTNVYPTDNASLSVASQQSVRAYQGGIKLSGTGATIWKNNLPDQSTSPYRKLIV